MMKLQPKLFTGFLQQTSETQPAQSSSQTSNNSQSYQIISNRFVADIPCPSSPSVIAADGQDPKELPRSNKNDLLSQCCSSSSSSSDDDEYNNDNFIESLGPKTKIKCTTAQKMLKTSTKGFRCYRQTFQTIIDRPPSNHIQAPHETLRVLDSFLQFFQAVNTDLFPNRDNKNFRKNH